MRLMASLTTVISSFGCWPCTMPVSRHSCEAPKIFLAIALFFGVGVTSIWAAQIPMHIIDPGPMSSGGTYAPARPWYITQDDYAFTLATTPEDYTLVLLDEDGEVVYTDTLPSGSTMFVLPSTLSGSFEIRLMPFSSTYYYRGYLEL